MPRAIVGTRAEGSQAQVWKLKELLLNWDPALKGPPPPKRLFNDAVSNANNL